MKQMARWIAFGFALTLTMLAGAARADYPEGPVRLVIPYPPGTGTDTLARFVAKKLEDRLGKPVVPENRAGSSGMVAAQSVIASPPDGHTLFFVANAPVATNVALFTKLPYDPVKDLVPIARLASAPMALLVPAASPYRSAKELMAAAAAQPGKLNYGSGSATYNIATEWLLSLASARANMVPYKGAAPALADLAGGQVDFALAEYSGALPLISSGKLRILGVTTDKRIPNEPDTPTLQEAGYAGYSPVAWWAMFAPAKTPPAVVERLEKMLLEILASDEAAQFLRKAYMVPFAADAQGLRKYQLSEIARELRVVEQAKIPRQ